MTDDRTPVSECEWDHGIVQIPRVELEALRAEIERLQRLVLPEFGEDDLARAYDHGRAEGAKWIRAFNRLEKAVTNHVSKDCVDSDGLEHAHQAILRDLGPPP